MRPREIPAEAMCRETLHVGAHAASMRPREIPAEAVALRNTSDPRFLSLQ